MSCNIFTYMSTQANFVELVHWFSNSDQEDTKTIQSSPSILNWKTVETNLPWSILFLLGGGFALASGFEVSGLSTLIGNKVNISITKA